MARSRSKRRRARRQRRTREGERGQDFGATGLNPSAGSCVSPVMMPRFLPLLAAVSLASSAVATAALPNAKVIPSADRVRVELGGQLFTEYLFKGGPRPYFYPVLAADGMQLNRDFPMKADTAGEESDHPHHRSLSFTHGAVNGVDFWAEGKDKGVIVNDTTKASAAGSVATIVSTNRWVGPDGVVHCTDETVVRLSAIPEGRQIDYEVTLQAPVDRAVVLGDTKEGSLAFRVAQWMTPVHTFEKKKVEGQGVIVNAEGVRDAATWGKKSPWVDYYAPKNGKIYGIAMFDSPKNPRHPTWWHVRDYGLFAANPFGQHDFEPAHKANPKAGDLTIPAGGSVTFRWRLYFHEGDEKTAKVAEQFAAYAAGK
jgi:hypothetical protein